MFCLAFRDSPTVQIKKLLQINSRYAKINPEANFFRDLENAKEMLERIEIPEIRLDMIDVPEIPLGREPEGDGGDDQTRYHCPKCGFEFTV